MRDILYFAEKPGAHYEALYLMPFIERTGGAFLTDDRDVHRRLGSRYRKRSDIRVERFSKGELASLDEPVMVYSNFYPRSGCRAHALFMHGVADKRGIARPHTFKDQRTFFYRASMSMPPDSRANPLSPRAAGPFRWLRGLMRDRFDMLLIPGPAVLDLFRNAGAIRRGNHSVIGFPRLDPVLNGEMDRSEVLEEFGLDPDKKTVLYAPTWHGKGALDMNSLGKMGLSIARAAGDDVNLVVRPHPRTFTMKEAPGVVEKLEQMHGDTPNVRLVKDPFYDTMRLMASSDLMISDYSSVGIEWLALDRPIIFADPLGDSYADPSLAEIYVRDAGIVVRDPEKFRKAISVSLKRPRERRAKRREYAARFFGPLDGKASQRGAEAIKGLLPRSHL